MIEVVAAAILDEGRVLAARRSAPPHLAGGWEFPGGKVEPGEDGPAALVREIREELGVDVRVGARLGAAGDGEVDLGVYAAAIRDGGVALAGADHDELRWLASAELDSVAWLPIDAELLPCVRARLRPGVDRSTL